MTAITSAVSLAVPHLAPAGIEHVRLLEAIGREGSISAAARSIGLSYKAAWSRVSALNTLAGRPLVASQRGGAEGGGASLTPEGIGFVEAFRRLEAETADAVRRLFSDPASPVLEKGHVHGGFFRTSARNALPGVVIDVEDGPLNALVRLRIAGGQVVEAAITRASLLELGLFPGRRALTLIKAPLVHLLSPGESGSNRLLGRVVNVEMEEGRGADAKGEVTLDIGPPDGPDIGARLVAVAPVSRFLTLGLAPGTTVMARFEPSQIILATD
ncbi:ModE family transcriptional regulator [Haematobacter missouriensis]|uniref:TOBE domain-containing protein n=1 Tax=Haematobacter missouriensis TaxID=366616 RepID=UPI0004E964D3|nr:TOBE domain-containing protein [Haematobacter missouriensis]KFI26560.1 ModE family transcriptional regulator [Haematobacter missouriensis]